MEGHYTRPQPQRDANAAGIPGTPTGCRCARVTQSAVVVEKKRDSRLGCDDEGAIASWQWNCGDIWGRALTITICA